MVINFLSHGGQAMFGAIIILAFMTTDLKANDMQPSESKPKRDIEYAIVIHGGAGSSPENFTDELNQQRSDAMESALKLGVDVLKAGGSSLDAVERVVEYLENDPQFNAGKGAVFNSEGGHELDASIMDGSDLSCGAVASVSTVKNPIKLARLVMTDTRHILLAADGAESFADAMRVERVENNWFDTPRTRAVWEAFQREDQPSQSRRPLRHLETGSYYGTVGCCALDRNGNLAAATSTGGMTNKKFGRVGDTPIVGAGTYADNKSCAISCTGIGEQFMRHVIAYDVAARMRYKSQSIEEATRDILSDVLNPGDGGIIGVDLNGTIVMEFNTGGMPRAAADSTGRFEVHWHK